MKFSSMIASFVLLAACQTAPPPAPMPLPETTQDTCNANRYANLIGQDATSLERVLILSQVRVIRPGQAVTTDFREERINFNVNAGNRISSIICG